MSRAKRSRKKRRRGARGTRDAAPRRAATMDRERPDQASAELDPRATVPPPDADPYARARRLRGEERDALARAELTELAPHERPVPLIVAVVVAAALGAANLVLLLVGWSPTDDEGSPVVGGLVFVAVMTAMAIGLWGKRYWALLGMEVLLALVVVAASLSLLVASNLAAVALCLGAAIPSGWLFWKLVRVMARVQLPRARRGDDT